MKTNIHIYINSWRYHFERTSNKMWFHGTYSTRNTEFYTNQEQLPSNRISNIQWKQKNLQLRHMARVYRYRNGVSLVNHYNPFQYIDNKPLQWRHNEHDGVSNHQPHDFYSTAYSGTDESKHQSSASLAFVTGDFPAQRASNAENVSIWWRHHDVVVVCKYFTSPALRAIDSDQYKWRKHNWYVSKGWQRRTDDGLSRFRGQSI